LVAWNKNWPSAQKVSVPTLEQGKFNHYWMVVYPLKDLGGNKKALLSMYMSANIIDTILSIVLIRSYWILIVTVLFIILLLFANSRLFEYSILYNKIKEVDAMKDEFISMASHELRTPITVIKGYVEMVLEDTSSGLSNDAKENLNIVNSSADRLASLIEDMLNVSRIEQGRLKIETKEMDVWPLIEETVKEMKVQSNQKGLELSAILEPDAKSMVNIDKDRFKQVLINIIGNSIKYTPSGSVEIKVKNNREKNLVVMIKDTGIGMSAKDREKLFQKFYRVKTQKTESITGTGLGLWITKQIIELMNGTISVDSMEGVGTQVTIEIPLISEK
ncbi:MAG: HAMP domain-containing sensor histidine kinase, partial [Candidatus Pacebacteria bacterium]|nr:HAMP domain-containing sensor histidine kinase [Candidatus Paceibacterota bacterium]